VYDARPELYNCLKFLRIIQEKKTHGTFTNSSRTHNAGGCSRKVPLRHNAGEWHGSAQPKRRNARDERSDPVDDHVGDRETWQEVLSNAREGRGT
jgi:hypothetical protein